MKQQWPADKVERWEISKLIPYARNSRIHSQVQIDQLAASIETWGWTMPCLVAEDGVLIAGHGRILAARQLGIEYIPVMIARGWTDSQVKAYRIADNKLTENGEWDFGMLALEIEDLKADDFDISLAGFADGEIGDIDGAEEEEEDTGGETEGGTVSLSDRFMVPPFSTISARGKWWHERKAAWLALGIRSEEGRKADLAMDTAARDGGSGLINEQYKRKAKNA